MTTTDKTPLTLRAGTSYRGHAKNPTHWTRLDTAITIATALITLAGFIGAASGWDFSL